MKESEVMVMMIINDCRDVVITGTYDFPQVIELATVMSLN